VLSLAGQCLFILVNYLVAISMGIQLKLWIFFVLIPMIAIISMAPSIGGLGVREAGSVYLFSHFISPGSALAFSVLSDILIYGFSLLSGVLFSLKGGLKSKTIHEMEELE
jgi:uncharacterized membrane protein YbhN (UPF0104 family)